MMGPPRKMPSRLSASRFLVLTRPSGALAHRLEASNELFVISPWRFDDTKSMADGARSTAMSAKHYQFPRAHRNVA
ncbi:unnamed protein product [Caenorhabditis auriculariae]|uniref:Uncharacterized protein n=1 Tax=Caenorhabditis auriculariae TaxID=2777116 RepID=A0A8S1HDN1_9PELO|nr:unnamed protein product [Caenorhabditis auriculariae]